MNAFMQTLRNLGPVRLGIIAGIAIITVAFMVFIIARTGSAQMSLLYADLDPTDAGRVTTRLDALNIPYQLRNDGGQILVPADMVAKARLQLASEGLPAGGSIGYEIFDKTQGLATSSFVQNINQLRALEGELSRTVQGIQGVRQARVHLVLPQRELFSRDKQDPSASILLRMAGQLRLDRKQVQAVQHLVATAVPGLKPERVSVVDERGTLLAGGVDEGGIGALSSANDLKVAYENRLARSVEDLLERTVGQGKARVEVAADMSTDRVSENSEQFNPDQQVVRSTQTVNDQSEQNENDNSQSVTIANNLPQGQGQSGGGAANSSKSNRSEETTNYEISRVVRSQVREPGGVARLSVAVLVDGTYANRDGQQVYTPRSTEQLSSIETLVKAAVGFNQQRGDQVNVVNLPFASTEDETLQQQKLFGMDRAEVMQLAQVLALGAVAVLVLLMIVRPLVRRVFESMPSAATAGDAAAMLGGAGDFPQLTGPTARTMMLPGEENEEELEEMIDLNRIEGRVKASSLRKIGEIVEKHPEDVVAIIRNWLYQES